MARIGVLLLVLGIGSLILPMLDMQFTLMSFLDEAQPSAGIVIAGIGAALLFLSMRSAKPAAMPAATAPAAATPTEPPAA